MDPTFPNRPTKRLSTEALMARLQWHEPVADTTVLPFERRRSKRLALLETSVTVWVPAEAEMGPQVDTTIVDVSEDGLGVLGTVAIPIGTVVAVQSAAGFAVGSITRCEPHAGSYRWGIAFENCIATRTTVERLVRLAKRLNVGLSAEF